MKQKPIIIYRKRGEKQKVIKDNILGDLFCTLTKLYTLSGFDEGLYININKNVESIKFQNVTFSEIAGMSCGKNTTCILENCDIESEDNFFKLREGNFEIINPNFENEADFYFTDTKNVKFYSSDKKYNIFSETETIEIQDQQSLNVVCFEGKKIYLHGSFVTSNIVSEEYCEEVVIGNYKNKTKIVNSGCIEILTRDLYLNNCIIQNDGKYENTYLKLNFENLVGKDFVVRAKNRIIINDVIITDKHDREYKEDEKGRYSYYTVERDKDGYISITDKDLLRLNLISSLKALKKHINANVQLDVYRCFPKNFSPKSVSEISKKQLELDRIKEELNKAQAEFDGIIGKYTEKIEKTATMLRRQLSKRKISDYIRDKST